MRISLLMPVSRGIRNGVREPIGVEEARTALRQVIGLVTLRPDSEGKLIAEFRGNIKGLLSLDASRPSMCLNVGSGGRI